MIYPTVAIYARGVWLNFTRPGVTAQAPSWPWLVSLGTLREQARASHLGTMSEGEIPHMTVTLENSNQQAYYLLGSALRAKVKVTDSTGSILFEGMVTSTKFGPQLVLEVDA